MSKYSATSRWSRPAPTSTTPGILARPRRSMSDAASNVSCSARSTSAVIAVSPPFSTECDSRTRAAASANHRRPGPSTPCSNPKVHHELASFGTIGAGVRRHPAGHAPGRVTGCSGPRTSTFGDLTNSALTSVVSGHWATRGIEPRCWPLARRVRRSTSQPLQGSGVSPSPAEYEHNLEASTKSLLTQRGLVPSRGSGERVRSNHVKP